MIAEEQLILGSHPHTLTLGQLIQSASIERRAMNEHVLATTILRYETESFFDVLVALFKHQF